MNKRGWFFWCALAMPASTQSATAQSASECRAIAAHHANLQNPDGGFAAAPGADSTLGATNSTIRILGFTGGSIPDPLACIAFVKNCQDPQSGGFAQKPGGTPEVAATAGGLMALGELNAGDAQTVAKAVAFLDDHAKTYEDFRIAAAALEAVKARPPRPELWARAFLEGRMPHGGWGDGPTRAFDTGGRAAALLRIGQKPGQEDAILKILREAQQPDGGWAAKDGPSDLPSTYRVMRAFFMLGEKPDLQAVRSFVAKHKRPLGYASTPDKHDAGGTYFALIVLRWCRMLEGLPPFVETAGFRPLFNGSDLDGWQGEKLLWSARDGALVGESPGLDHNTFLAAPGRYRDFALQFSFRLVDGKGNSGVQFRSDRVPPHEMSGYQADIGEGYWGALYDESRRNRVLAGPSDRAKAAVRTKDWNQYFIRAFGDRITMSLNGVPSVDYRETDSEIPRDGLIATQIHAGGPMRIEFRDMLIQVVPSPEPDDKNSPGFRLRSLETDSGARKYTLYLPEGYDGARKFPVVLFLHGAGERGEDGARCAQVGLGPAIAGNPAAHPYIALFPQARRTWQAGSDDANAALAVLDHVMKEYSCDADRVILTGLSMGGAGSWSIGAAMPERFSAVVPVCGFGDPATALRLKDTPLWTILGDADMERIVRGTRAIVAALREAGARPRYTEYRAVGHNSWDRAYSSPELITWMLEQRNATR